MNVAAINGVSVTLSLYITNRILQVTRRHLPYLLVCWLIVASVLLRDHHAFHIANSLIMIIVHNTIHCLGG